MAMSEAERTEAENAALIENHSRALIGNAAKGDLAAVNRILEQGHADVNAVNGVDGTNTALSMALQNGHLDVAERLLQEHEKPGKEIKNPTEVVISAGVSGNPAAAELLKKHGVDLDAENDAGKTAMERFAKFNDTPEHKAMATKAIDALAKAGANPFHRDNDGKSALDIARETGDADMVAAVNLAQKTSENNLKDIAAKGDLAALDAQLKKMEPDLQNNRGASDAIVKAATAALEKGEVETAKKLLEAQSKTTFGLSEEQATALAKAAIKSGNQQAVDLLNKDSTQLKEEVKTIATQDLTDATIAGNDNAMRKAINNGADIYKAAAKAEEAGDKSAADRLLHEHNVRTGTNVDTVVNEATGNTKLHEAAKSNDANAVVLLLRNGADTHIENKAGKTAKEVSPKDSKSEVALENADKAYDEKLTKAAALVQSFDKDGDGQIKGSGANGELTAYLKESGKAGGAEKFAKKNFDLNGDGQVTKEELAQIQEAAGKKLDVAVEKEMKYGANKTQSSYNLAKNENALDKPLDRNGDGKVSREELFAAIGNDRNAVLTAMNKPDKNGKTDNKVTKDEAEAFLKDNKIKASLAELSNALRDAGVTFAGGAATVQSPTALAVAAPAQSTERSV